MSDQPRERRTPIPHDPKTHHKIQRRRVARAFGATVRAARRADGMSQEKLAERGDFDRTYPSLLERGLRTPTLTVVLEIAQALGMSPERLVCATVAQLHADRSETEIEETNQ